MKQKSSKTNGVPLTLRSTKSKKTIPVELVEILTTETIAVRAYYISEKRHHLGLSGDPASDWVEAEQQLQREITTLI